MTTHNPYTLYSVVLKLAPADECTVAATMGHQVHAAFLRTVEEADPELSTELHDPLAPIRPFTVSLLQGLPAARDGLVRLSPERAYWLRLTMLQPRLFERFMSRFLHSDHRPVLRLGQAELLIHEILATPGAHPWAGYASWIDLASQARPASEITLHFVSPTAFGFGQKAWGKKVVTLPEPAAVFGSLLRSWSNLAPPAVNVDESALEAYVREDVVVKRFDGLQTQMLRFNRSPQVGFVGRVTYGLMASDTPLRCQLNALADLAFYTGVGMKTTMGMGMARRMSGGAGSTEPMES